ncbi:hypothetical protein [Lactobacillus helveticus]|uniref:Uncharacterized protein n=1 Tax=Lactobacillus helveticus TaxID=1587 RepID=A0A3Q8SPY2_LACHE|nr:hypothetical protein [Lactobacillus helveticus]AFR22731.1 hypothetical protein R0052_10050 [Lactobacillus helveticus R0052]AZK91413.1 hypothetical protein LH5_01171 [Lactobacillus helveticus]MCJ2191088.1 hypothetical protein [Lactobacillus helveticus]MED7628678.1 hypothetical protein [Lactobacillus helveticus]MZR06376.1 hypothetical protein [Lactobacillus helveticus]
MSLSEAEVKEKMGIDTFSQISQLKKYHLSYNEKYRLFLIKENSHWKNNSRIENGFAAYLKPAIGRNKYKKQRKPSKDGYQQGHIFGVELIQHISKLKTPEFENFKGKDKLPNNFLENRLVKTYNAGFKNIFRQTEQANGYGKKKSSKEYIGQAKFEQQVNNFLKHNESTNSNIQVYYEAEAIYNDSEISVIGTRLYARVVGDEKHPLNKIVDSKKKEAKPYIPFHVFIPNVEE